MGIGDSLIASIPSDQFEPPTTLAPADGRAGGDRVLDEDWVLRQSAFHYIEDLARIYGDILPWAPLSQGFSAGDRRITLIGARGIWSPAGWSTPISITTSPNDPYGDKPGADGLLRYRYYGVDPNHRDNAGLRNLMETGRPLIYFKGVEKGLYIPLWPVVIVGDDPSGLTFLMACEDVESLVPGIKPDIADSARRSYVTRLAMTRLHQAGFRKRVLHAYSSSCAICHLKHAELLDAAHIIGDKHELGDPIVPNGLALCKIHHAAFDANILGVRPDSSIEIRTDILAERDGPMLKHGLQDLHGARLLSPHRSADRPDPERLEIRYEEFRAAS
jgi:putative restriction endonuclease